MLSVSLLAVLFAISRIPSALVAPAAGIVAGGVLGNSLSAAWNGMEVPNPLIVGGDEAMNAFNLADVWALTGILLLVCAIGSWLIRNRDLIPRRTRYGCPVDGRSAGSSRTSTNSFDKFLTLTNSGHSRKDRL